MASMGAVFAVDAADSIAGEQWLLNRGSGGQVLKAKYGSVARAEIRNRVGLVTPSASGNTASVPDAANLRISGPLEICGRYEGSTRPAATGYLSLKSSDGTYANRWYGAALLNSGQLGLYCRDSVSASRDSFSSSALPSSLTAFWWKVTVNPATGVANFYYATDGPDEPTSWTDLGSFAGTPFTGGTILTGSGGDVRGHHLLDGVQKRLIIRNGIGGTTILDIDFTGQPDLTTSFTCSTGQTVTVSAANAVDTNDPSLLTWRGENYVFLPGLSGNNITVPDSTPLRLAGTDLEIVARYSFADHTPGGTVTLLDKYSGVSGGYIVQILSDGRPLLVWGDGAAQQSSSAVNPGFTDGVTYWLRVRLDINNGGGGSTFTVDWAPDSVTEPTSWNALSVTHGAGVTQIGSAGGGMTIGPNVQTSSAFKRIIVRSSFGGTPVLDIDFTQNYDQYSFVCTSGQTVTINRAASGRRSVMVIRPTWLFGSDDYLEVADNALLNAGPSQDLTVLAAYRIFDPPANYGRIVTKSDTGGDGWELSNYTTTKDMVGTIADVADADVIYPYFANSGPAFGTMAVAAVVIDRTAAVGKLWTNGGFVGSTPLGGVGDTSSAAPMRIGTMNTGGAALSGEVFAVGVFRRSLLSSEVEQVAALFNDSIPPSNSVAPSITPATMPMYGMATCSTGSWLRNPSSYAYQWQSSSSADGPWSNISGETSSTMLVGISSGNYIRCAVTATNSFGSTIAYSGSKVITSTVVNPVESLGAVFSIDAANSVVGEQWALNRGVTGNAMVARYGSVGRAEIRNGVGLVCPGVGGNYASAPLSSPTDIEIVFRVINPATVNAGYPIGNFGANLSFGLFTDATKYFGVVVKDGVGANTIPAVVGRGVVADNNQPVWVRVTRVSSTGQWTIQVQPDGPRPTSWGTVYTTPGTYPTGALTGVTEMRIGQGGNPFTGVVSHYAHALTIGGPFVVDVDFTAQANLASSFTANHQYGIKSGALVGINSSSTYASIPHAANLVAVGKDLVIEIDVQLPNWTTSTYDTGFVGKYATNGYLLDRIDTRLVFGVSGTNYVTTAHGMSDGQRARFRCTHITSTGQFLIEKSTNGGSSWSTLHSSTQSPGDAGTDGGHALRFGGSHIPRAFQGSMFYASVRIDGTLVAEFSPSNQPDNAQSWVASTGQTVTIAGATLPTIALTAANAVDTNDPLLLPFEGRNYTYFPGVIGGYIGLGHSAILASLSTLEFRVKVRFDATGSTQYIAGTDSTHFALTLQPTGQLNVYALNTSLVQIGDVNSSVVPGLTAGVDVWLRGKVTIATAQCEYWYSYDTTDNVIGVSWTSLTGGIGSNAGTTPLLSGSAATRFGCHSSGIAGYAGRLYVGQMICDGVVRAHVSCTSSAPTLVEGNQVNSGPTIFRPATGRKPAHVTRAIWLFGTDDYMEIVNNSLLNIGTEFDVLAVYRDWDTASNHYIVAKGDYQAGAFYTGGWQLRKANGTTNTYRFLVTDGATSLQAIDSTYTSVPGELVVHVGGRYSTQTIRTKFNSRAEAVYNGSPMPTFSGNTSAMTIGRQGTNLAYADMELMTVAVFTKRITDQQAAVITSYFGGS